MKYDVNHYIKLAFANKQNIEESETCGCYYCCTIFNKEQVEYINETDGRQTAECPHCKIDSVIDDKRISDGGEELTIDLLKEINNKAF